MLRHAPAPYDKTKVLRIVHRTVFINQLSESLVFKEPMGEDDCVLHQNEREDYSFLANNRRKAVFVRFAKSDAQEGQNDN